MDDEAKSVAPPRNAFPFRRRTAAALVGFVLISAGVHFTLGPELTKLSPHWVAPNDDMDQVSVVTISHKEEIEKMPPPTPTPTPPPLPLPRTNRDLAMLKYRELGKDVALRTVIRPPARRKATLIIDRVPKSTPHDTVESNVVVAMPVPTPRPSQPPGPDKTSTDSNAGLAGNVVWGDDNPVRIIKQAALGVSDQASGTARVEVDIDPDGHVIDAQIIQSSGDAAVDDAALAAARASTFAPATLNGLPVHGSCELDYPPPAAQST